MARRSGPRSCLTDADKARAKRAAESHVPATAEAQRQREANEVTLANAIGGGQVGDNEPFDVIVGSHESPKHLIEVKTIVRGRNDKITMHPESLKRKTDFAARHPDAQTHTVVFDDRVSKIYHRSGLGSFRLGAMEDMGGDAAALQELFR